MNNREIKWEIKKVAPGMVKIETNPLGRMPTFDEFKQKAKIQQILLPDVLSLQNLI